MRKLIWGLLLSLLCAPALANWNDPAYVKRAFSLIALNNEYDNLSHPVRKWHKPIRVYLDHRVGDAPLHTMLTTIQLGDLARVTGHDIALVDAPGKANIRVVFTTEKRWQDETRELWPTQKDFPFRGAICMAHMTTSSVGEIKTALIVIPVDLARHRGKLLACLVEELTQTMGLPNDSDKVYPSIFNDSSKNNLMSPLDITLLRLLYSPEVRAGMGKTQVMPLLDKWFTDHPGWPQQSIDLYLKSEFVTKLGL
ncbi:DUF2927 domain-containing protein [Enterovibrio paralichthyis]|uniref:DUF2927 domain-containing protein n=1 Tax=Enterovibrio paralichthyis TaxID=2853805 RepID=UPI001C43D69C|nr:DUF2927 domain-containing protein [Enterovibrio paralichthyis]MBV7299034.1 DUF2927 domain-containing protein [Enterovibrio paralichthyis]